MSEGKTPKRKCNGANCPMQVGYVVPETCPEPEKCRYATFPQTNADRIRNMTDEELVDVIHCPLVEVDGCHTGKSCALCILRWLRSPVEESHE
jgi:hypothetical protein|nr:MAG TPA: hypothetical protein [Caudoviricetes sp.]